MLEVQMKQSPELNECEFVLPVGKDAWFWQQLKMQASTVRFNPAQETSLEKLVPDLEASGVPLSEKRKSHRYFIVAQNKFVGVMALRSIDWTNGTAEVGYLIAENEQGKGYASRGLELLIKTVKSETNLKKLKAHTVEENIASHRVLEKNQFQMEGKLKEEYEINGRRHDARVWGLLLPEGK